MDTPPSNSRRKLLLLTGLAALLIVTAWFAFKPFGENGPGLPGTAGKFSRGDSLKLVELRNLAIGNLENHEFSKADEALIEIQRFIPTDPFAPRNLAICRQLALEVTDKQRSPQQFAEATVRAKEAIEKLKLAEPDSFVAWTLSARVASKLEQPEEALAELREAVRRATDSVGPAYELFVHLQNSPADKKNDEGFNALRKVYEKEPDNLFVIKDWLPLLAQRRDPELAETLTKVQETIGPFVETIKINSRIDLNDMIEAARAALAAGKWPEVQRSMTIMRNIIVSEAARDLRFVMLNSLEYLIPDFNELSMSRLSLPGSGISAMPPIRFNQPEDVKKWPDVRSGADVAITDFDLDGRPDLVVLDAKQLIAWGRTTKDETWSKLANIETEGDFSGLIAFDFDDDVDSEIKGHEPDKSTDAPKNPSAPDGLCQSADPDVILFGPSGLKLFVNTKDPKTKLRTLVATSGGSAFDHVRDVNCATVADLDSDGDLDLVIATPGEIHIFSNRGNTTFEEISARSVLPPEGTTVTAMAIVDWDRDSDTDLLIATPKGAGLLENVRHGRLRYRNLDGFAAVQQATSLQIGDFDGNVSWDVVGGGPKGVSVILTNRTPAGLIDVRKSISLVATPTRTARTGDFDNDGLLDILVVNDNGGTIYRCDESYQFLPVTRTGGRWLKSSTTVSIGDLDRDGDLDLVVMEVDRVVGHSNQCRETDNSKNGWQEILLTGSQVRPGEQNWDKRVNHINLGGILEIKSGQRYQASIVTGPVTHFGLGANRRADVARIYWTNGIPTNVVNPAPNQTACIEQVLITSCPFLYTWNGDRFEFVTDLLWNAPLGMKFAENVVAPWREWEYLKIDGRQLTARQHEYQLRVTSELWEADYFDEIKLFAVDHPAGTDVFTNEKVGPAAIAEPKIHTVAKPRQPIAARDSRGRDVLSEVAARDGVYTKTFNKRLAQGLTEEHYLELDLGELPTTKNATLFLTGWMYPGTTSLSVQFSQNPDMPKPKPPALYAPDANGEWREVRPYMGFPGGKTKSIAVDVSDIFTNNDHRLRIVSTMELFWDHVFFTVNDDPVEFHQIELALVHADLRDRGGVSSHSWPSSTNGPDQFDYAKLVPGQQFPPMLGKFTRYGDVLPLLMARDDQLVVCGSGDEIQLAFAEPANGPPVGWIRDFVIYTVGWDKDADPNTVYGNAVEPMPFEAMTVYAHREGESRPLDPAYAAYLREYQIREQNPTAFWKSIQRWK